MADLWRRAPSKRLRSLYLTRKTTSDAAPTIASGFWETPDGPTYYGTLRRWTGAAWAKAMLRTNAGSWQRKPLYCWDGTGWRLIDATGV